MRQQGQVFELRTTRAVGRSLWASAYRAGGRGSRRVSRSPKVLIAGPPEQPDIQYALLVLPQRLSPDRTPIPWVRRRAWRTADSSHFRTSLSSEVCRGPPSQGGAPLTPATRVFAGLLLAADDPTRSPSSGTEVLCGAG